MRDGGPGFAGRDVEAEHARAVFALHRLQVPASSSTTTVTGLIFISRAFSSAFAMIWFACARRQRRHRSLRGKIRSEAVQHSRPDRHSQARCLGRVAVRSRMRLEWRPPGAKDRKTHEHSVHHHRSHHRLGADEEGQSGRADHRDRADRVDSRRVRGRRGARARARPQRRRLTTRPRASSAASSQASASTAPDMIVQFSTGGRSGVGQRARRHAAPEARHGFARRRAR